MTSADRQPSPTTQPGGPGTVPLWRLPASSRPSHPSPEAALSLTQALLH